MNEKRALLDCTQEELKQYVRDLREPAFRAGQIWQWLYKGARFSEMTNLPKALQEKLESAFDDIPMRQHAAFASQKDDTVKFLFACQDENLIEGVLMHYHYGYTLCISTQVGCRMGCAFCASTLNGCERNLSAGEMLAQVLLANRYLGERGHVGHVVLMGSGEPLDNYAETIRFLRMINAPEGLNISLRNISVSTCGLVPRMEALSQEGLPITLSISLHAPNDDIRKQIMPIANRYPIGELTQTARDYVKKTGRRVVFEYALIDGLNSAPEHARELAQLVGGMQCHVNLIPLNRVEESPLKPASAKAVQEFLDTLTSLRISATCRREMGTDISGACGQLRHQHLKNSAKIDTIEEAQD